MYSGNFYDFLGVPKNATQDEIKRAFRKLAKKYHSDTGSVKNDDAMINLLYVYSVLSDPIQRFSYDDSIAFSQQKSKSKTSDSSTHNKSKANENIVEDYSNAVFVDGIQAIDSIGKLSYIRLQDYIYYPVTANKRILFYQYKSKDYYRVRVSKIYSKKKNSFYRTPLFVVKFQDIEQIVFEKDFANYWLSQSGYNRKEKFKALSSFIMGLIVLGFVLYLLSSLK